MEGAVIGLERDGELVIKAVVTVDHHSPVAVVAVPGVPQEVLLTPGALLLPAIVSRALRVPVEVCDGVVFTEAAHPSQGMTTVCVSITVALLAGVCEGG